MEWVLVISDSPKNKDYPIIGHQIADNGARRGPFLFKVQDIVDSLVCPMNEPNYMPGSGDDFRNEKRIPTLPYGTVGYSSSEEGKERISMVIDKGIWPIKYHNNPAETYLIGFPKLIIQYVLLPLGSTGHKRIISTKIFAIEDDHKPVTNQTKLYLFPFPNVSKSNGTVCWGGNSNLTVANLTELEIIFPLFLAAPFGEDYGMSIADGSLNFGKYIQTAQDKPFNDDLLLPYMRGDTHVTFEFLQTSEYIHPNCR